MRVKARGSHLASREARAEVEAQLYNRITQHYVAIFLRVQGTQSPAGALFFDHFYEALAESFPTLVQPSVSGTNLVLHLWFRWLGSAGFGHLGRKNCLCAKETPVGRIRFCAKEVPGMPL